MSLLILSSSDVDNVASTFTPLELQNLMARVFRSISCPGRNTDVATPHRMSITMANHTALFMPSRLVSSHPAPILQGTAIKVVSVPRDSQDARGLPASSIVLDEATGVVKALVNARSLTALRNAAGSLLSIKVVGLDNPINIVAFGAGKQIEAHLGLLLLSFPSIRSCIIINRAHNARFTHLRNTLQSRFPHTDFDFFSSSAEGADLRKAAVQNAHIIICATSSTLSLFPSTWVQKGTHIILIGSYTPDMHECDSDLVHRAIRSNLLVDSREACKREAGELIAANLDFEKDVIEIGELVEFDDNGELLLDRPTGRVLAEGHVTMFKSVGVGLQDVVIASAVVARADEKGVGTRLDNYDSR